MGPAYLTGPEGNERTEGEPGFDRRCAHLGKSGAHGNGEGTSRAGLNLDFCHLPRAEGDIGEELRRSRASQPDSTLVVFACLLAGQVHVGIFEDFIETVLEGALEGVADQGGPETFPSALDTLLGNDGSETGDETLVFGGVDL